MIFAIFRRSSMQVVVFLILALNYASAQSEGDFCACQPSSYTITLDFGLECDDSDITTGLPGIEGAACLLRTTTGVAGEIPEDPFPLSVISIEITELDQVNEPINQVNYTEIFLDGGSIVFDSVTLTDSAVLPRTFQAILVGANAAGEELVNTIVILFTQSCTDYPVLTDGMQIGWLVFSTLSPPTFETCPLVGPPDIISDFPSVTPSLSPDAGEILASDFPSFTPSGTPSGMNTVQPLTEAPTTVPLATDPPETEPPATDAPGETESPVQAPVEPEDCVPKGKGKGKGGMMGGKGKGDENSDGKGGKGKVGKGKGGMMTDDDSDGKDGKSEGGKGKGGMINGGEKDGKGGKVRNLGTGGSNGKGGKGDDGAGKGKGKGKGECKEKKEKKTKNDEKKEPSEEQKKGGKGKKAKKERVDDEPDGKKQKLQKGRDGANSDKRSKESSRPEEASEKGKNKERRLR